MKKGLSEEEAVQKVCNVALPALANTCLPLAPIAELRKFAIGDFTRRKNCLVALKSVAAVWPTDTACFSWELFSEFPGLASLFDLPRPDGTTVDLAGLLLHDPAPLASPSDSPPPCRLRVAGNGGGPTRAETQTSLAAAVNLPPNPVVFALAIKPAHLPAAAAASSAAAANPVVMQAQACAIPAHPQIDLGLSLNFLFFNTPTPV